MVVVRRRKKTMVSFSSAQSPTPHTSYTTHRWFVLATLHSHNTPHTTHHTQQESSPPLTLSVCVCVCVKIVVVVVVVVAVAVGFFAFLSLAFLQDFCLIFLFQTY